MNPADSFVRTYGAFIQNVIAPIVERTHDIISIAESNKLPLDEKSVSRIAEKAIQAHLRSLAVQGTFNLLITIAVCLTAYAILN